MGANAPDVAAPLPSMESLRQLIAQWNANRLDLFEISEPNEDGEFQGVMRFYFQEAGAKVATKCIRISSTASTKAVIETLIEKFRPDMRMLSIPQYALYEIHESGEERKLDDPERPLLVQLNWHSDDREGRFLLKRIDEQVRFDYTQHPSKVVPEVTIGEGFKRKLSKREKKQLKKLQEKTKAAEAAKSAAEKLYNELPETSFTRSISNPEAVMRRRRQQKLEKKLAQFRSRDGGPDTGGTLKIYGQSLCEDVPYKTLLLSVNDNAAYVVKEMLAKYGLTNQDPLSYCLVQVTEGEGGEYILDDDESPLAILMSQSNDRGSIMFHVRRRPPDCHPRKRKKKPTRRNDDEIGSGYRGSYDGQHEPMLIELLPDGSETGRRIALETDVTEVGSEWGGLQLAGLRPRHCVIASTEGIVTLTPSSRDADIYVNGQRIYETTILQHGAIIRFGRTHYFRFSHRAGQTFSEREIIESPKAANINNNNNTIPGGGVDGRATLSPPLSPTQDDAQQRMVRPDSILPATLELPEAAEEAYLSVVILNVIPANLQFKLAPTYAIYLAARYRATTHFRPDVTPHERAHLLSAFLLRVSHILMQVVQERNSDANSLAFWMANSSELLHFLKSDRQIGAFSLDAQDVLAEVVQLAFRHLVTCIQGELSTLVGHFFLERDEEDDNATTPMLGVLGSGMTLLRRSRVNAALTIQLFSQLFHFINMAIFNKLIVMEGRNYCSRVWGNRLRRRLGRIETWAEKQGLELAADCHLVRIIQACHLLQAPKNTSDEVAAAASSCFKLNSIQLQCLLMKYQYESDEIPVPPEILDNVVRVAESTVDEAIRADGRHIRVEEEPLIGLAFILPEDGYSCDIVRGIPTGLVDFLTPLSPLCRLTPNPSAAGYWTIYFQDPMRSPSAMSGRSFAAAFNNLTIGSGGGSQAPHTPGSVISDRHSMMNNNNMTNLNMSMSNMSMSSMMGAGPSVGGGGGGVMSPNGSVGGGSGIIGHGMTNGHIGAHPPIMNGNSSTSSVIHSQKPDIHTIKLQKISNGLGLSIVAAKPAGQDVLGIYIKSVVKNGSADADGRLAAGDQLLSVDGQSLIGISQEEAAKYLVKTGPVVHLEVAKQAALYHGLATMLNQPSPELSRGGFNAPRRMSERDLPSKVLREQNHDMAVDHPIPGNQYGGAHPMMMQSRMHSSKSVPSLNSDVPPNAGGSNNQMIRSPGHIPNNVNGNGHGHHLMHGQQNHVNDSPNGHRYPQGYPNMSMTMQHGSKSMTGGMAAGHVNNVDAQTAAMRSRSIQSLADPPLRPDIGNKQPSTPALHMQQSEEERFYQNVGFYPPPPPPPTNPANMPVRTYIPYSNSTGNISSSAAFRSPGGGGNHISPHYPGYPGVRAPPPNLNASVPSNLNWQQQQQRINHAGHLIPQQPQQQHHLQQQQNHGGISRDLLRQEAKMLEMQDELRRREERAALMMSKQQLTSTQQRYSQQYPPQHQQHQQQRPMSGAGGPPAPAPKPYRIGEGQEVAPGRPPLPEEYKNSPQFSASLAEIPKGAFSYNNDIVSKNVLVTNPWDREAKEVEAKRKKEKAKYIRDQQIMDLETFPHRTPAQDDHLRALKLEREFQRRADEMQRNEEDGVEDDDGEEDDRKAMVRRLQEDLERTRVSTNGNTKLDPMEEERARKIEEMRRKKLELEAAQAAEERLVREAAKRREEELKRQHQMMQQQTQSLKHQSQQMHLQHQQQAAQPPQSLSYQSPYRSSYTSKLGSPGSISNVPAANENHHSQSSSAPPLPKSPPPLATTYKSAMQQSAASSSSPQKSPVTPPQSSPKPKSDKKSVSFNDMVATNEPPASPQEDEEQEKVREDPNKFLTEATALLASPRSPDVSIGTGSTPGVIGAQEVYRDPRMRRLAEKQQQQQATSTPKPEKLSFKEKMRMFAMESGDIDQPKDKVKVSKAQREIESPLQVAANAVANSSAK